jgi:hypothetical protein
MEGEELHGSRQDKESDQWLCDNIRSGNYQETSAPLEL